MRINLVRANRFTTSQLTRLNGILDLFMNAVNSSQFESRILQHERFITLENFSNSAIYSIIMGGREIYGDGVVDNEADLNITLIAGEGGNAMGKTVQNKIFTYSDAFNGESTFRLAGHYAHEYCHTLGFLDPRSSDELLRNVPYEVGYIISDIADTSRRIFMVSEYTETVDSNIASTNSTFKILNLNDIELSEDPVRMPPKKKAVSKKKAEPKKKVKRTTTRPATSDKTKIKVKPKKKE